MNDDTLLLYFYDELSADERNEVEAALAADPALAEHYRVLSSQLSDWQRAPLTPAPESAKRRWHNSIDHIAAKSKSRPRAQGSGPRFWMFGLAAAMTSALVAGIFIGTSFVEAPIPVTAPDTTTAGPVATSPAGIPASFTRGLQLHLQNSQAGLSRLGNDSDADRMLLTLQLIEQNRLFEKAATQNNARNLARVLRAFEPILLKLASEDIAPQDMEALRKQLSFELKVMLTKLDAAPSEDAHTT
ncbi:MAG: hypothetical protein RLN69_11745 [Woeseiaceae bacterium]